MLKKIRAFFYNLRYGPPGSPYRVVHERTQSVMHRLRALGWQYGSPAIYSYHCKYCRNKAGWNYSLLCTVFRPCRRPPPPGRSENWLEWVEVGEFCFLCGFRVDDQSERPDDLLRILSAAELEKRPYRATLKQIADLREKERALGQELEATRRKIYELETHRVYLELEMAPEPYRSALPDKEPAKS